MPVSKYNMARLLGDNLFRAIQDAKSAAGVARRGPKAQKWYKKTVETLFSLIEVDAEKDVIGSDQFSQSKNAQRIVGKMYTYLYDPKTKSTLPYYDKFPLVFILEIYSDGFLGLNLHYLPIKLRLKLLADLERVTSDTRFDDKTKLRISYQILKGTTRFDLAVPCIKRYLTTHVRSKVRNIPATDWELACFLPVQKWEKATAETVYADSRRKARKARGK